MMPTRRPALVTLVLIASVAALAAHLAGQGTPLVRYTFDEIVGTPKIAKNTGSLGSAADAVCGKVTLKSGQGIHGKALTFSGNKSFVRAPSLNALNFGTGDFRVRVRMNTGYGSSTGGYRYLVTKHWQGGPGFPGWWLAVDSRDGRAVFQIKDGTTRTGNPIQVRFPLKVNDAAWHVVEGGRLGRRIWVSVDNGPLYFAPVPATYRSISNGWSLVVGNRAKIGVSGGFIGDIDEAEVLAGGCPVAVTAYGRGCPGTGRIVPVLSVTGCPVRGEPIRINVSRGRGRAPGFLIVGLNAGRAAIPVLGCTLLVSGPFFIIPFRLNGTSGRAGAGHYSLPLTLPLPLSLAGLKVNLQAAVADVGVPTGVAATNGIEFTIR